MDFPKNYTINGQHISVEIVESLKDNDYGDYSDALERIRIAKTLIEDDKIIKLSKMQMENTFWHEVYHSFQFHCGKELNEVEASLFAGMMVEFIHSSGLRIVPNEIINDKPEVYDK